MTEQSEAMSELNNIAQQLAGRAKYLREVRREVKSPDLMDGAATAIRALQARCAELEAGIVDPNAVHVNMLRGTIARPSPEQIIHIYGEDLFLTLTGGTNGQ